MSKQLGKCSFVILLLFLSGCFLVEEARLNEARLAFFDAVNKGDTQKVEEILDTGVLGVDTRMPIEGLLNRAAGAIHVAAFNGDNEMINLLVRRGADVNARGFVCLVSDQTNPRGTPFYCAVHNGHGESAFLLLDLGADPYIKINDTFRAAISRGLVEIVNYLMDKDIDINSRDLEGMTALHWAVEKGYVDIVSQLVLEGAYTNLRTYRSPPSILNLNDCYTPLGLAEVMLADISSQEDLSAEERALSSRLNETISFLEALSPEALEAEQSRQGCLKGPVNW